MFLDSGGLKQFDQVCFLQVLWHQEELLDEVLDCLLEHGIGALVIAYLHDVELGVFIQVF